MKITYLVFAASFTATIQGTEASSCGSPPKGEITCGLSCQCGQRNCFPKDSCDIKGGTEAGQEEFPWQVSMSNLKSLQKEGGAHLCGGVLVNREWIVTAAHCFFQDGEDVSQDDRFRGGLRVFTGVGNRLHKEKSFNHANITSKKAFGAGIHTVKKVLMNPNFDGSNESKTGDIALVKLNPAVKYPKTVLQEKDQNTYVRPACIAGPTRAIRTRKTRPLEEASLLTTIIRFIKKLFGLESTSQQATLPHAIVENDDVTESCHVSGYGLDDNITDESAEFAKLQKLSVKITSCSTCKKGDTSCKPKTSDIICASSSGSYRTKTPSSSIVEDACRGDSGGPLSCMMTQDSCSLERMRVRAIVKGGLSCNSPKEGERIGAYTDLKEYSTWIKDNTKINNKFAIQFG